MKIFKKLKRYMNGWRLYFVLLKTRKWKSKEPLKTSLIDTLNGISSLIYDELKREFKSLPKNPLHTEEQ